MVAPFGTVRTDSPAVMALAARAEGIATRVPGRPRLAAGTTRNVFRSSFQCSNITGVYCFHMSRQSVISTSQTRGGP